MLANAVFEGAMGAGGGEGEERLGETVGGRYSLRGILGMGGQSIIYRAKDEVDGDEVAVKILKRVDGDAIDRMFREARALLALNGTAALRVLHQTSTDDGMACLVTELLRGKNLDEHLGELEDNDQRMSFADMKSVLEPIVTTLEAAHSRGIVHRDLKPENIFMVHASYGGGVRLLDFGYTKFVHMRSLTQPGIVAGSPMYLAPEAWRGAEVDHRADVYGLAVIMFRVLGGEVPFKGRVQDLIRMVKNAERPSLKALRKELPDAIDGWVKVALAVDPEKRFQGVRALWNGVWNALGPEAKRRAGFDN